MRARINFKKITKHPVSFDYQYFMASMLYFKLAEGNVRLANEMHSHTNFKFYNFSNLILNNRKKSSSGLNFDNAHFYLTSPDKEFIRSFAEGMLQKPDFDLGRAKCTIESIEILKDIKIPKRCRFKTLSPVYIKTMREVDNKLTEWDLYPSDGKFYENLHNNLRERYEFYYGHELDNDHFELIKLEKVKPKRITINGCKRRCSHMEFEAEGNPELLKFGYDAGYGEKNAMGFGCVEVITDG